MLQVNFKAYNDYVTDSLTQWDVNRSMIIKGLNLGFAPRLTFSNSVLSESVCVQSVLNSDGSITSPIPNFLLQWDRDIVIYVCDATNDQYKALERVRIPVISRPKPADYMYTDNCTYEALNGQIAELIERIEKVESAGKDDELVDIRNGSDGKVFESAGEAVRGQINKVNERLDNVATIVSENTEDIANIETPTDITYNPDWESGYINSADGTLLRAENMEETTEYINVPKGTTVTASGGHVIVYGYDTDKVYTGKLSDLSDGDVYTVEDDIIIRITADSKATVFIVRKNMMSRVIDLENKVKDLSNNSGTSSDFSLSKIITWDGNTDGLVSIDKIMFKVSDETISEDELKNIEITVTEDVDGEPTTMIVDVDDVVMTAQDGITILQVRNGYPLIFIVPTDTSVEDDDENTAVIEKGVYLLGYTEAYVSRFEYAINKIESKYINGEVLPSVSADDNGKMLQVVDGAWQAVTIANAEEGAY